MNIFLGAFKPTERCSITFFPDHTIMGNHLDSDSLTESLARPNLVAGIINMILHCITLFVLLLHSAILSQESLVEIDSFHHLHL